MAEEGESMAEESGMPFEERCRGALTFLMGSWSEVELLVALDLERMQETGARNEAYLATLGPEARAGMEEWIRKFDHAWCETDASLRNQIWEVGMRKAREIFGTDATQFALDILKRRQPPRN